VCVCERALGPATAHRKREATERNNLEKPPAQKQQRAVNGSLKW
jgi:hypothetical protein